MKVWVMIATDKNEEWPEKYLEGVYLTAEKADSEREKKRKDPMCRKISFQVYPEDVQE